MKAIVRIVLWVAFVPLGLYLILVFAAVLGIRVCTLIRCVDDTFFVWAQKFVFRD